MGNSGNPLESGNVTPHKPNISLAIHTQVLAGHQLWAALSGSSVVNAAPHAGVLSVIPIFSIPSICLVICSLLSLLLAARYAVGRKVFAMARCAPLCTVAMPYQSMHSAKCPSNTK